MSINTFPPSTASFAFDVVVPIPTLPELFIASLTEPAVISAIVSVPLARPPSSLIAHVRPFVPVLVNFIPVVAPVSYETCNKADGAISPSPTFPFASIFNRVDTPIFPLALYVV